MYQLFLLVLIILSTEPNEKPKVAVGIDIGTTKCCCYVYIPGKNGGITPLFIGEENIIPSVVSFKKNENGNYDKIAGHQAMEIDDDNNFFYYYKSFIGRTSKRKPKKMKKIYNELKYKLSAEKIDGKPCLYMLHFAKSQDGKLVFKNKLTAVDATATVLKLFKSQLEKKYEVASIYITIPTTFNDEHINATKLAAEMAGFKDFFFVYEPIAAVCAFQYRLGKRAMEGYKIVADLSGGFIKISLIETVDGYSNVIYSLEDFYLGIENVNHLLFEHFSLQIDDEFKNLPFFKIKLRIVVEKMKIELCEKFNRFIDGKKIEGDGEINVKRDSNYANEPKYVDLGYENVKKAIKVTNYLTLDDNYRSIPLEMTYDQFEKVIKPFMTQVEGFITNKNYYRHIINSGYTILQHIKMIICVGGSSRIPSVRFMLQKFAPEVDILTSVDANRIVAKGAAIDAANNYDMITNDDEGFNVRTAYGIKTDDGWYFEMLKEGSKFPASSTTTVTNVNDGQKFVQIILIQERDEKKRYEFKNVGTIKVDLGYPRPRGTAKIEVKIEIKEDYRVILTAKEISSDMVYNLVLNREDVVLRNVKKEIILRDMEMERENIENHINRHATSDIILECL